MSETTPAPSYPDGYEPPTPIADEAARVWKFPDDAAPDGVETTQPEKGNAP